MDRLVCSSCFSFPIFLGFCVFLDFLVERLVLGSSMLYFLDVQRFFVFMFLVFDFCCSSVLIANDCYYFCWVIHCLIDFFVNGFDYYWKVFL